MTLDLAANVCTLEVSEPMFTFFAGWPRGAKLHLSSAAGTAQPLEGEEEAETVQMSGHGMCTMPLQNVPLQISEHS